MMENKIIPSQEQHIQDAASNKSDFVKINNNIYAIIQPNKILYIKKEKLDNFKDYFIPKIKKSENKALSITFVPTLDCNLNCIYCYSKGGDSKLYMSSILAKKFLKKMYNPKKHNAIYLRFAGGGEPFLNFSCIKEITQTAKEILDNMTIHCITNGTFNEEQMSWILKNKPQMRISYDGLEFQKTQRPFKDGRDSSDLIRNNIKELIKNKIEVITQSTITSLNINCLNEIIKENYNLGVKTIKMEPVYITENSRGNNKLNVSPEEFVSNFLNALRFIKENKLDIQIDTAYFSRPTLGHYCSMATGNIILTPTGEISSCVEITNNCDLHSNEVFYGKFNKESEEIRFDNHKKDSFKKLHFSNFTKCLSCNLKLICRGGCPLRRIWNQNEHTCQISKKLIPKILKLFYEDPLYTKILIRK